MPGQGSLAWNVGVSIRESDAPTAAAITIVDTVIRVDGVEVSMPSGGEHAVGALTIRRQSAERVMVDGPSSQVLVHSRPGAAQHYLNLDAITLEQPYGDGRQPSACAANASRINIIPRATDCDFPPSVLSQLVAKGPLVEVPDCEGWNPMKPRCARMSLS